MYVDVYSYFYSSAIYTMGRPSIKNKKEKRNRQKKRRSNSYKFKVTETVFPMATGNLSTACESPLMFSDRSGSGVTRDVTPDPPGDKDASTALGDADIDLVEMELYDLYRKDDGQPYSVEYLQKCIDKLKVKVREDKVTINKLQRDIINIKADNKDEVERIRCFYDAIAFGRSRAGRIVRTAIGSSSRAQKISQEMRKIFSVHHNCNYQ